MIYSIEIASVIDREDLVAEIWIDEKMFAEITLLSNNEFKIEIYQNDLQPWSLDLRDLQEAMNEAQKKLKQS